ncbi:dihydropteroate synthase [candidate division GN15 bacterium]|uniref:Dihydropteroate synthase n=1 Tax=candidate division GN15 bacterium TaxID=2072418 RepID=A0A855X4T2_9BACT|nr:MAG: dihydropteroate synthase [candidate division GN15 bacterium]
MRLGPGRTLRFERPLVTGILNVTPDSFSDGGRFASTDTAVNHALELVKQGADIIDVGGESSRPGAEPVSADDEMARVVPVIRELRRQSSIPISVDTYKSTVAEAALDAGADIINDISALRMDPELATVAAAAHAPVILMHMLGTPRTMQQHPHYENCVEEIVTFFRQRIDYCLKNGIARDKLILDPGIGFGKRLEDNLAILSGLGQFKQFGVPVLVGASRKSFIGLVHAAGSPAGERLGGSIAAAVVAVQNGADMVRVHDVAETVEALKVLGAIAKTS